MSLLTDFLPYFGIFDHRDFEFTQDVHESFHICFCILGSIYYALVVVSFGILTFCSSFKSVRKLMCMVVIIFFVLLVYKLIYLYDSNIGYHEDKYLSVLLNFVILWLIGLIYSKSKISDERKWLVLYAAFICYSFVVSLIDLSANNQLLSDFYVQSYRNMIWGNTQLHFSWLMNLLYIFIFWQFSHCSAFMGRKKEIEVSNLETLSAPVHEKDSLVPSKNFIIAMCATLVLGTIVFVLLFNFVYSDLQ